MMNFFKITNRKSGVKNRGSGVRDQGSVVNCEAGFTLIEMIIVMAIIGILAGIAYSTMRTPNEQIVCKEIFSQLQLEKMKAVASGSNTTPPFDVDNYARSVHGVTLNKSGLSIWGQKVSYLDTEPPFLPWGTWPDNGINFNGGNTVTFTPKGMGTAGSVYLKNVENPSRLCAVSVLPTGIVRMATSLDGGASASSWN